jgi:signal transduction histidine kinase
MVESMKQVSENYLSTEKGYADDWAAYIASCHMTAEEALDYIRTTNTQENRAAHLVDMADFSARSTFVRNGNPWVHCYEEQQKLATMDSSAFLDKMEQLFNAGPDEVPVLGKYRVGESQRTVVSVGTRVMIREADGSDRPYLLLRLIPVEYLQNTWTFPTEFPLAEISMIVNLSINQNLRRAVDMAEHVNQAKTRFLSTMSHDIRTPMNAIIGYTDLLEIYGDDVEKREDYLGKIKSSSEYLLSLLNDVLEMARIESGKYIMDETVTDIREFDRSICDVFENQLEQKGIRSVFL